MPLKESDKERTKLLATALNTLGVNTIVAGFVTPMVAFLYKIAAAPAPESLVPVLIIWPVAGGACHIYARLILADLDEP